MDPVLQRIGDVTIERVVPKKQNSSEGKDELQNVEDSETDFSMSGEELSDEDITDLDEKAAQDDVPLDEEYEHITLPSEVTIKRKGDEQNTEANSKKHKTGLENEETEKEVSKVSKEEEMEISKNIELLNSVDELTDDEYEESEESEDEMSESKKSKSETPKPTTEDSIDIEKSDFIEKLTQGINFDDTITEIKTENIDKDSNSVSKESDNTSEYDYDITEKLREMGEISVQPVKKGEQSTRKMNLDEPESEVSVTAAKKIGSESDDEEAQGVERKIGNLRRNIREVMDETKLDEATLAAQRQEMERLRRVQEQQRIIREVQRQIAFNRQNNRTQNKVISLLQGQGSSSSVSVLRPGGSGPSGTQAACGANRSGGPGANTVLVKLPNGETKPMTRVPKGQQNMFEMIRTHKSINLQNRGTGPQRNFLSGKGHITPSVSIAPVAKKTPPVTETPAKKDVETIDVSSSDDDCIVLSEEEEEPEPEEDPHNSGMHTNDAYNVPDEQGRVLINVGHPENEADIFLAPQIARVIKPHQIGGVRFLFDNVIESVERFNTSTGFGCILAHSMGLGKTLQVVCFSDIFLRHTSAKTILCIMPINTLQNWVAEYNMWLPTDATNSPLLAHGEVRPRNFNIHVLNDSHKSLAARAKIIQEWHKDGGVLLMGYELYRLLSLKRNSRAKKKKKTTTIANNPNAIAGESVDLEEDDKNKQLFDEIHEALVKPGPDLVICDEGHRIKNSHASISVALKQIRSKRRVVLTGYPLQNNLLEYWCMVDFVRPNYLGTKTEFSNMFERPIQNGQCVDSTPQDVRLMRFRAHVLHSLLEGFVQRRSHSVLQVTLPQKEEYVMLVRMTAFQRQLYDTFMNDVVRTKTVPNPLKAFAVCCKIWNHPDVLYYFLKKREESEAVDIDLEEVVGTGTPSSSSTNLPTTTTTTSTTPSTTTSTTTTPKRSRGKTKAPKKEKEKKKISSLSSIEDSIQACAEGITSDSSSVSCSLPPTPAGGDTTTTTASVSIPTTNAQFSSNSQSSTTSSTTTTPQPTMSPFPSSTPQSYTPYPPSSASTPAPPSTPSTPAPSTTPGEYQNNYNQNYPNNQYNNSNQFYPTNNSAGQYGNQNPPPPAGGYYNQNYPNYQGNTSWPNNNWSNSGTAPPSTPDNSQQSTTSSTGFGDNPQYPPSENNSNSQYPPPTGGNSQYPATNNQFSNSSQYPPQTVANSDTTQYPQQSPSQYSANNSTNPTYSTSTYPPATQYPPGETNTSQYTPPGNTQFPAPPPTSQTTGSTSYPSNSYDNATYSNTTSAPSTPYPPPPPTASPYPSGGPPSNTSQYPTENSQYPDNSSNNSSQYPGYSGYPPYSQQENSQNSQNFPSYNATNSPNQNNSNYYPPNNSSYNAPSDSGGITPVSTAGNYVTEIKTEPNESNQYYTSSNSTTTTTTAAPYGGGQPYQGNQPFEIKTEPGQQPYYPPAGGYNPQSYGYGAPPPPYQMYGGYGPPPPSTNYNNQYGTPSWGQQPNPTPVTTATETPTTGTVPDMPMEVKEEKKEDMDTKEDVKDILMDVKKEEKLDDVKIEKEEKPETKEEPEEGVKEEEPKEIFPTAKLKEDAGINYDWAVELLKGYVPGCIENSAKMEILFCIIRESMALGDRILLFSQSLFTLNLIEELLQKNDVPGQEEGVKWARNVNYYRLDGSTSALEREKLINEFNANDSIYLFMVSTRAGSLGINLVGANRVVVFDASWNPCHDTQAVCRVYRYGQKKPCFVYRLVMDNCLEKKIYDRQINKQGMSDRVVDECNPDAHLSMKDVTNLCWDDEKESEVKDFSNVKDKYIDIVMQKILDNHSQVLSKEPFQHESLLVDRKEKKLSQAEKRMAKRSYEMEKQAVNNAARNVSYNYHGGIGGTGMMRGMRGMAGDGSMHNKPIASVRPMQAELNSQLVRDGQRRTRWIPAEVWQRQGMTAQEMTLPLDVVIPTNGGERGNIVLKAGQKVLVLKSPKGIYMQLECGKIVAIRTAMKMRGNTGGGSGGGNSGNVGNCGGAAMSGHLGGKISPGAGTPKSSDEASSDGSLLKKVNPRQQKSSIPLPLKNNSAVTITPKLPGNQPKSIKPFTQVSGVGTPPMGGVKIPPNKAPIRPMNARIQNIRYPPNKIGGPQQKNVQLGKAKPFITKPQDEDIEMKSKENPEDEDAETHVIQSSDEDQPPSASSSIPPGPTTPTTAPEPEPESELDQGTEMEFNESEPKANEFDSTMDSNKSMDGSVEGGSDTLPPPPNSTTEDTMMMTPTPTPSEESNPPLTNVPQIFETSNEICLDMDKPFPIHGKMSSSSSSGETKSSGFQILEVKSLDKSEMIPVDTFQESHQLNANDLFNNTTLTKSPSVSAGTGPKSSLKNYRHNFGKTKAMTPSALSRLEQTTSSIGSSAPGDLKQPSLQSSLDKITAESALMSGELGPEVSIIPKKTQSVMPLKDGVVIEQIKPKPRKNAKKKPPPPPIIETPPTIELDSSDNESPNKLDSNIPNSGVNSGVEQQNQMYQHGPPPFHQPPVPPTDPNNMYPNYNYGQPVPPNTNAPAPYGGGYGYNPQPVPYSTAPAVQQQPQQAPPTSYQSMEMQQPVNTYHNMESKNVPASDKTIKSSEVVPESAQQQSSTPDYRRDPPGEQKIIPPPATSTPLPPNTPQQTYPPQQPQGGHVMGPPPMNNTMNYGQPAQYPPPNYTGMPYPNTGYQPYPPPPPGPPYNQNFAPYGSAFHRPEMMPPYSGAPPPGPPSDNYGAPPSVPPAPVGGYGPPPPIRPGYAPPQYAPYPPPPTPQGAPHPQQPQPMYPGYNDYNQYNTAPGYNQYMTPGPYPAPPNPNPPPS
ncbi:uncharacterized protein LOC123290790 isoform X2 [Chrysoperla carnea]|uniref:uncharacterized protein LOC123290790 isoform X2 n=1 Tax=Chrysoperla carnea TaxID=189513 RepID=UPI001D05F2A0|nr:uncharacterized protein LOC123290790 isoform X2 [Chrysoperla carnea]